MPIKSIADYNDFQFSKIQNNITWAAFRVERAAEVAMADC